MSFTVRVVIQARVGSSRQPGKILAPLAGRPLLAHIVRRMRLAGMRTMAGYQVTVATTTAAADDATESLCDELGVPCFRGATDDVLGRYVAATDDLPDDAVIVRATADNPLYCPRRTVAIVDEHIRAAADYTCIQGLSYVVPEIIRAAALRTAGRSACDDYDREHVTPYLRSHPERFRAVQLPPTWRGLRPDVLLTVDTPDQYARMADIFQTFHLAGRTASLEDVYAYCERHDRPLFAPANVRPNNRAA